METGDRFGEYRLGRRIGSGGQGEVYEATCGLNLQWALKIGHASFTDEPKALRKVAEEAVWVNETFRKIPRNCGILAGEHYGVIAHRFYVKMRLLRGQSLADRLRKKRRLPVKEALVTTRKVAAAVALAHQHNALHHDLKPANIFLEHDGAVQVLDWGCVRLIEAGRIAGSTVSAPTCTVGYAALEQYQLSRDTVATAADVYSLGVVFLEMLTGVNPFLAKRSAAPTRTRVAVAGEQRGARDATGQTRALGELEELDDGPSSADEHFEQILNQADGHSLPVVMRLQANFDLRQSSLAANVPEPLQALLCKMLVPDAKQRLASMDVVVTEIDGLLAEIEKREAQRHSQSTGINVTSKRQYWWIALLATAALGVIGALALRFLPSFAGGSAAAVAPMASGESPVVGAALTRREAAPAGATAASIVSAAALVQTPQPSAGELGLANPEPSAAASAALAASAPPAGEPDAVSTSNGRGQTRAAKRRVDTDPAPVPTYKALFEADERR